MVELFLFLLRLLLGDAVRKEESLSCKCQTVHSYRMDLPYNIFFMNVGRYLGADHDCLMIFPSYICMVQMSSVSL